MFEWIDLIFAFALGAMAAVSFIVWLVNQWANRIRSMLQEAVNEVSDPGTSDALKNLVEQGKIMLLEVEIDHNQFFCYNYTTHQFVCQGKNVLEIVNHFKERFPGVNAVLHTGDEQALTTLRQQLKEARENSNSIGSAS